MIDFTKYYLFSGTAIILFILNNLLYFLYKKNCINSKIQNKKAVQQIKKIPSSGKDRLSHLALALA